MVCGRKLLKIAQIALFRIIMAYLFISKLCMGTYLYSSVREVDNFKYKNQNKSMAPERRWTILEQDKLKQAMRKLDNEKIILNNFEGNLELSKELTLTGVIPDSDVKNFMEFKPA